MKTFLVFVIGLLLGAGGLYFLLHRDAPVTPPAPASQAADPAPAPEAVPPPARSRDLGDRISDQLAEWHLTPEEIKRDLASTGRVIRNKARAAGERIDDARIVSVIKAKYVLDDRLQALDINVDCHDGRVTLRGTAPSAEAIGRAVTLALDTAGVVEVSSELQAPDAPKAGPA